MTTPANMKSSSLAISTLAVLAIFACAHVADAVPVNCVVSAWTGWRGCSAICLGGTQNRTRTIITQPSGGGSPCPTLVEIRSCNTGLCQTPDTYPPWDGNINCGYNCWNFVTLAYSYGIYDGIMGGLGLRIPIVPIQTGTHYLGDAYLAKSAMIGFLWNDGTHEFYERPLQYRAGFDVNNPGTIATFDVGLHWQSPQDASIVYYLAERITYWETRERMGLGRFMVAPYSASDTTRCWSYTGSTSSFRC